jgi:hypothetical protein
MSTVYSLIPERSLAAYSNVGSLVEVLCALITDPDEADDAAREYGVAGTPHNLSDFALTSGANGVSAALQTVAEWTMQQQGPEIAIRQIIAWDHRVGAWCACQVSREALRYVPPDENRPRAAIETAERWVVGDVAVEEVRDASYAAADAAADYSYAAARDGTPPALAYAARSAADASHAAYVVVFAAAVDAAAATADAAAEAYAIADAGAYIEDRQYRRSRRLARIKELARLREVIANACMKFPR